jgi:hypothetical protein
MSGLNNVNNNNDGNVFYGSGGAANNNSNRITQPDLQWAGQSMENPLLMQTANFTGGINNNSNGPNGVYDMNLINMNGFISNNNNGNMQQAASGNSKTGDDTGDDMKWLEQALTNPQLASSAKFLLQTTNYINSCSGSSGNYGIGNNFALNNVAFPSKNQIQLQTPGENPQGNSMHVNFSNTAAFLPQITRNSSTGSQNQVHHFSRQGARSALSTSSQSSGHTAGIANLQGFTFNDVGLGASDNGQADFGNGFQFHHQYLQQQNCQQQQNQHHHHQQQQQYSMPNNGSMGVQVSSFQQQQFVNPAVNLPPQQQSQNQRLQYPTNNNFVGDFCWNVDQNTMNNDDDFNIEPADYRQDASEDIDLSFLLDDAPSDNSSGEKAQRARNKSRNEGSSAMTSSSQSCNTPAPTNTAPTQSSTPGGSQPGSSQQMQEHLREITKQHMHQFQMTHAKQIKKKKKTKKAHKESHDTTNEMTSQGQNGHVMRNLMGGEDPTAKPRVNSVSQLPVNLGAMHSTARTGLNDMKQPASYALPGASNAQTELSSNNIVCATSQGPSNMDCLLANGIRHQYIAAVGGGMKRKRDILTSTPSRMPEMKSLYEYVESMLNSRGYSLTRLSAKEIGYITEPSPLQTASFGFAVCSSIKPGGEGRLSALLSSGLSPNPVNKFGDSPFFLACKRGLPGLIKTFLDNGTDVRVADGFGRTALHYVLWCNTPCFASAKLLLGADARLICVMDNHGNTPLDFIGDGNK